MMPRAAALPETRGHNRARMMTLARGQPSRKGADCGIHTMSYAHRDAHKHTRTSTQGCHSDCGTSAYLQDGDAGQSSGRVVLCGRGKDGKTCTAPALMGSQGSRDDREQCTGTSAQRHEQTRLHIPFCAVGSVRGTATADDFKERQHTRTGEHANRHAHRMRLSDTTLLKETTAMPTKAGTVHIMVTCCSAAIAGDNMRSNLQRRTRGGHHKTPSPGPDTRTRSHSNHKGHSKRKDGAQSNRQSLPLTAGAIQRRWQKGVRAYMKLVTAVGLAHGVASLQSRPRVNRMRDATPEIPHANGTTNCTNTTDTSACAQLMPWPPHTMQQPTRFEPGGGQEWQRWISRAGGSWRTPRSAPQGNRMQAARCWPGDRLPRRSRCNMKGMFTSTARAGK